MAFQSKTALGGKVDPNINTKGRIKAEGKMTNRELRERELLTLLRKLKPLVADSINTAAKIMKNDQANHANQLKAATILLANYKEMVLELYDEDHEDEAGEEIQQPNVPAFSLKVIE